MGDGKKRRRRSPPPRKFADKLTTTELAEIFGVSYQTVHNWVLKRGLPHHRTLGRQLRFDPREVEQHLEDAGQDVPAELRELAKEK